MTTNAGRVHTRTLSDEERLATYRDPMQRVAAEAAPEIEFWSYFDAIAAEEFRGYDCSPGQVSYVYRDASGRFEHVLVNSEDQLACLRSICTIARG